MKGRMGWLGRVVVAGTVGLSGCTLILGADKEYELDLGSGGAASSAGSGGNGGIAASSSSAGGNGGGGGGVGGGGVGGGGGTGGGGMPSACMTEADCPDPLNECIQRTCSNGMCGTMNLGTETALAAQTPGDCKTAVCDGSGGLTNIPNDADVDNDGNDCTSDACSGGVIVHTDLGSGAGCSQSGGAVCNGSGSCVACVGDGDCGGGMICQANKCVPPLCQNGAKDPTETDVDCGGACAPCADTKACLAPSDCVSSVCTGGICLAATCSDSVKNGAETDVDCGGSCAADCAVGKACGGAGDCVSGVCLGGVCQGPTCSDSVKNGTETDVDCGATCFVGCETGQMCVAPWDCTSGVCTSGICKAPTCSDMVKNGYETDVDCGGVVFSIDCPPCSNGYACMMDIDCLSNYCIDGSCYHP